MWNKRDLFRATVLSVLFTCGCCEELRYMVQGEAAKLAAMKSGGTVVLELPDDVYAIEFTNKSGVNSMMMKSNRDKFKMEQDLRRPVLQATPDERRLQEQIPWGIERTYEVNGVADIPPASYYPSANEMTYTVCVIDSGYDIAHPDLPSDATNADPTQGNTYSTDTCNHGTHCAGTIAAIGNNNQGVVGVYPGAPNMKIVKVFDTSNCGWMYSSGLIAAVQRCYDSGARITSMSLGGGGSSAFEANAFRNFYDNLGMLNIAAAGNSGTSGFSYPASYDSVMSVAATDINNNKASFSQYNNQVDIAAPGVSVRSTLPGNSYASWQGTSMATPHVAGAALVLWNKYPGATNVQIRNALANGAIDLGSPGYDTSFGHGLLNYWNAVGQLDGTYTTSPTMAPVPCTAHDLTISVTTDNYPQETAWTVKDDAGNTVFSSGSMPAASTTTTTECLQQGCYTFEITDTYGDGICCGYGTGSFTVTLDGVIVLTGAQFTSSMSKDFCAEDSTPTTPTAAPIRSPVLVPNTPPATVPTAMPVPSESSKVPTPTASPSSAPTESPTSMPTTLFPTVSDMCIPAGSLCFAKHRDTGCDDPVCQATVCDEREQCCEVKWNRRCMAIAQNVCMPCECIENSEDPFLLRMKRNVPQIRDCEWLGGLEADKIRKICKKFHSFEDIRAARFVCPVTCGLPQCEP